MPFSIREALIADAPVIVGAYEWLFEESGRTPAGWDEERAQERIEQAIEAEDSVFYIAISSLDASLVGICCANMDRASVRYGNRCRVEDLAIDPAMRSRGIGRRLIAEARAWAVARGAIHLELDTGESRDDSPGFYEQLDPDRTTVSFTWELAGPGPPGTS